MIPTAYDIVQASGFLFNQSSSSYHAPTFFLSSSTPPDPIARGQVRKQNVEGKIKEKEKKEK